MDLVPTILRPTAILCERLKQANLTGETLNLKYVFPAVTLDIINAYCFAREPTTVLEPDFGKKDTDNVAYFLKVSLLVRWKLFLCKGRLLIARVEYSYPVADAFYLFSTGMMHTI